MTEQRTSKERTETSETADLLTEVQELRAELSAARELLRRCVTEGYSRHEINCFLAGQALQRTTLEPGTLQCTAGCEKPICGQFTEQDDGEGRVDTYCATCGHTSECHELLPAQPPEATLRMSDRNPLIDAISWLARVEKTADNHANYALTVQHLTKMVQRLSPTKCADDPLAAVRWICPKCTTVNGIDDTACLGCGQGKPSQREGADS